MPPDPLVYSGAYDSISFIGIAPPQFFPVPRLVRWRVLMLTVILFWWLGGYILNAITYLTIVKHIYDFSMSFHWYIYKDILFLYVIIMDDIYKKTYFLCNFVYILYTKMYYFSMSYHGHLKKRIYYIYFTMSYHGYLQKISYFFHPELWAWCRLWRYLQFLAAVLWPFCWFCPLWEFPRSTLVWSWRWSGWRKYSNMFVLVVHVTCVTCWPTYVCNMLIYLVHVFYSYVTVVEEK